jgi:DNA-binding transcriptional LysR family regulator
MQTNRGVEAFVAVAEHLSFAAAARALGLTPSALSQSVRALEERLGVPLLVRSTRSVSLTDAGRRLFARLSPALRETAAALEEARGSLEVAQGTLRLSVGRLTVPVVIEPVLKPLLAEHPKLEVEVAIDDRFVDIVATGFDAGIRLSEAIQPDFTIVRLTSPFRLLVAGAPAYFARRGRPKRPRELLEHDCINYRMASTGALYAWEFERRGKEQQVAVKGRIACNDGPLMLNVALAGLGLVYVHEQALRPHVERGELELVLVDYATWVPGFFLYFPRQRRVQPKLRAFIDVARRVLQPSPTPLPLVTGTSKKSRPLRRRR